MTTYTVTAKPWRHGWELYIDGVGVTQSHGLKDAEMMVRDYLALDLGDDVAADAVIVIRPEVDGIELKAAKVRAMVAEYESLQAQIAAQSRQVARDLRAKGLTGADTAVVLGVSPQRVSQLVNS